MTTKVEVTACCADDICVVLDVVEYTSDYEEIESVRQVILNNGDSHIEYIYGTKQINNISERRKV